MQSMAPQLAVVMNIYKVSVCVVWNTLLIL